MEAVRQEDTRQLKYTDRAEGQPENKHMGSDTVTISIATDEEIKPVDGADSEQVYLNSVNFNSCSRGK
jgi:hypothetical protein